MEETENEKRAMAFAQALENVRTELARLQGEKETGPNARRAFALAITKLDECRLWMFEALTTDDAERGK